MVIRRRVCVGSAVLMLALVGPVLADGSQGLGSSQPNRPDVSVSSQYHVYRWQKDGVTYVQVNDQGGNVQMAVASGGGEVLVLPIGAPSNVQVTPASSSAQSGAATVYRDSSVTVKQAAGTFLVSPTAQSMPGCTDPAECSAVIGLKSGD